LEIAVPEIILRPDLIFWSLSLEARDRAVQNIRSTGVDSIPRFLSGYADRQIRTGIYCVYKPDPRVPIEWSI
jgi:hypothetical protein